MFILKGLKGKSSYPPFPSVRFWDAPSRVRDWALWWRSSWPSGVAFIVLFAEGGHKGRPYESVLNPSLGPRRECWVLA